MYIQTNMAGMAAEFPAGLEVRQGEEEVCRCQIEPPSVLRAGRQVFDLQDGQACPVFEAARNVVHQRWIQVLPSRISQTQGFLQIFANGGDALVFEIGRQGGCFTTRAGAALSARALDGRVQFIAAEEAYD